MNPFAGLIGQVTCDRPRPAPAEPCDLAYHVTIERIYRPTGSAAAMLSALESRRPMTSVELASVGSIPARQVGSILRLAVTYGLVRYMPDGRRGVWEWAR